MVIISIMLFFFIVSVVAAYMMEILDLYLFSVGTGFIMLSLGYLAFQNIPLALVFLMLTGLCWGAFVMLRQLGIY